MQSKNIFIFTFLIFMSSCSAKIISSVEYLNQSAYPTGCESVTTVMCLRYHKINISVSDFIDEYLKKGEIYIKDGIKYGPHPNNKFIGSPYDKNSYGCYSSLIEKTIIKILEDRGSSKDFVVENLDNFPLRTMKKYIDYDIPIIFWATIEFLPAYVKESNTWIIEETGEKFTWTSNEHCLLLIGYDDNRHVYYFLDPWNNNGLIEKDIDLVEVRHKEQFSMAVAVVPKNLNLKIKKYNNNI